MSEPDEWTYAKAGVDIKRISREHEKIRRMIKLSKIVLMGPGHYASLIKLNGKTIALHTDGVGTKVILAQMLEKYDTIGIDCIAMNVNDVVCLGAEPIAVVDYIALERMNEQMVNDIVRGLLKGAEEAGVDIVGGETAVLPDVITGYKRRGFDLSATVIGLIKSKIIDGSEIKFGDAVIGLRSTGLHSNGYTLVRKLLLPKYDLMDRLNGLDNTLGEELLKPTKIYSKSILKMLKKLKIKGIAHITGGAFTKLRRLIDGRRLSFVLDEMPEPQPIFRLIQEEGGISMREMYRTFNMGVGMCLVVERDEAEEAIRMMKREGIESKNIGKVVEGGGIYIMKERLI